MNVVLHNICLIPYGTFVLSIDKDGEKDAIVFNSVIRTVEIKYIDDQKLDTLY